MILRASRISLLSGRPLSALPKWVVSVGGEYTHDSGFLGLGGQLFADVEANWRTSTYGDPSDSKYTLIEGYGIVNMSLGFRQAGPWEVFIWVKNLFDANYIQNLTVQAGNSGLVVGTPNDPRTIGLTVRAKY